MDSVYMDWCKVFVFCACFTISICRPNHASNGSADVLPDHGALSTTRGDKNNSIHVSANFTSTEKPDQSQNKTSNNESDVGLALRSLNTRNKNIQLDEKNRKSTRKPKKGYIQPFVPEERKNITYNERDLEPVPFMKPQEHVELVKTRQDKTMPYRGRGPSEKQEDKRKREKYNAGGLEVLTGYDTFFDDNKGDIDILSNPEREIDEHELLDTQIISPRDEGMEDGSKDTKGTISVPSSLPSSGRFIIYGKPIIRYTEMSKGSPQYLTVVSDFPVIQVPAMADNIEHTYQQQETYSNYRRTPPLTKSAGNAQLEQRRQPMGVWPPMEPAIRGWRRLPIPTRVKGRGWPHMSPATYGWWQPSTTKSAEGQGWPPMVPETYGWRRPSMTKVAAGQGWPVVPETKEWQRPTIPRYLQRSMGVNPRYSTL